MATNYDALYQAERHALGEPTQAFVSFFEGLPDSLTVLDLGCGQGRDALFIARLGDQVTGIDSSPAGIEQLVEDADKEGLAVTGIIADLTTYQFGEAFDVVVIDRTLHMLQPGPRLEVLEKVLAVVSDGGYVLIADEPRNLPALFEVFKQHSEPWTTLKHQGGFLFVQNAA